VTDPARPPAEKSPPVGNSPSVDTRPPINAEWLARMRSMKPDFLARMFEIYLADEPKRFADLCAAVVSGDMVQTNYLAHSIKGAAATLGMERLCDACRDLEHSARDGETQLLAGQLKLVEREMEAVFAVMRAGTDCS